MPILTVVRIYCASLFIVTIAYAELFTALIDLTRVIEAEKDLSNDLLEYITSEENRLSQVKSFADELRRHSESIHNQSGPSSEQYVSNPVNAFLLIKRFAHNWPKQLSELLSNQESHKRLMDRIEMHSEHMPVKEDLKGAADAMLRLQDTYRLSSKSIADGNIHPLSQSSALSAEECFYLGQHSFDSRDLYHTQLWMQEAINRLDQEEASPEGPTVNRSLVLDYLSYALYKQGRIQNALAVTNEWLTLDPEHPRAHNNKAYFERVLLEEKLNNTRMGDEGIPFEDEASIYSRPANFRNEEEFIRYESLCRGEDVIPDLNAYRLSCNYYVPHPHYIIGPVKQEVARLNPRIVIWYDIIHHEEIEEMKELATPKLNRATVQNAVTGKLEFARYRISKSAWLPYSYSELTEIINDRIVALTNIDISTAEDLQIVNYGIGGQYEPHFDFARRREKNAFEKRQGNRIATLLFYLSDVEAGGATVFTQIGAKVWPKKGSAAFWWNLFPSGDGDLSTRHAACPVLAGSKWVMNKWFHERGQEFRRPCRLARHAPL